MTTEIQRLKGAQKGPQTIDAEEAPTLDVTFSAFSMLDRGETAKAIEVALEEVVAERFGGEIRLPAELARDIKADAIALLQISEGAPGVEEGAEKKAVQRVVDAYLDLQQPLAVKTWRIEEVGDRVSAELNVSYFGDEKTANSGGSGELAVMVEALEKISSSSIDLVHHELRSSGRFPEIQYVAFVHVSKELISGESDRRYGMAVSKKPMKALLQALVNGFNRHYLSQEG